jgi:Trm5-related predicted tRNA methylase
VAVRGGITRENRAIRAGSGRSRRNYSRKSSNSSRKRPFGEELLEKVEQFEPEAAVRGGVTRESRAIRAGSGRLGRSYSRKSSNSSRKRPFEEELLEKVEQFEPEAAVWGGITRENRAIRAGSGRLGRSYSRKSSNSSRKWPFGEELLEKVEQFEPEAAVWGGVTRESRAIRAGSGRLGRSYSRKSSNSSRKRPFEEELLEKIEQFEPESAL